MKKFKKSEIAIYAIALMLVTAGYFNYSTFEQQTKETYSEDINGLDDKFANVGDAVLVSNNEVSEENELSEQNEVSKEQNNEIESNSENTSSENTAENVTENITATEATNVTENTNNATAENDYYASAKLERDKMYAEMISNYQKIIDNTNASEAQKSIATQELTKINNTKNAIMICENLISTKGFDDCVILVNESSVNVVIKIEGGLNAQSVAKIQNIVSRELNVEIDNIHISENA